jgi:hypothetical protein
VVEQPARARRCAEQLRGLRAHLTQSSQQPGASFEPNQLVTGAILESLGEGYRRDPRQSLAIDPPGVGNIV